MATETVSCEKSAREERAVEAFERVSLDGIGHADVRQGDEDRLTVEAPESLMPYLKTYVDDGTLVLCLRREAFGLCLRGETVRFDVTMRQIRGLAIDGSGSIRCPRVVSESLDASIDGAGRMEIGEVDVESLKLAIDGCGRMSIDQARAGESGCSIDGAGTIELARLAARRATVAIDGQGRVEVRGRAESLGIAIDGTGSVLARGLRARAVGVSIDGVGKVETWAEESLDATIDGYGRVDYVGSPSTICKRIDGAGRVVHAGSAEIEQPPAGTAGDPTP